MNFFLFLAKKNQGVFYYIALQFLVVCPESDIVF